LGDLATHVKELYKGDGRRVRGKQNQTSEEYQGYHVPKRMGTLESIPKVPLGHNKRYLFCLREELSPQGTSAISGAKP